MHISNVVTPRNLHRPKVSMESICQVDIFLRHKKILCIFHIFSKNIIYYSMYIFYLLSQGYTEEPLAAKSEHGRWSKLSLI